MNTRSTRPIDLSGKFADISQERLLVRPSSAAASACPGRPASRSSPQSHPFYTGSYRGRPMPDMIDATGLSQTNVSFHMRILRQRSSSTNRQPMGSGTAGAPAMRSKADDPKATPSTTESSWIWIERILRPTPPSRCKEEPSGRPALQLLADRAAS